MIYIWIWLEIDLIPYNMMMLHGSHTFDAFRLGTHSVLPRTHLNQSSSIGLQFHNVPTSQCQDIKVYIIAKRWMAWTQGFPTVRDWRFSCELGCGSGSFVTTNGRWLLCISWGPGAVQCASGKLIDATACTSRGQVVSELNVQGPWYTSNHARWNRELMGRERNPRKLQKRNYKYCLLEFASNGCPSIDLSYHLDGMLHHRVTTGDKCA